MGGLGEDVAHDNLFTLRQRKWVEEYPNGFLYPPMNTARSSPAVVSISDGELLAVIGGCGKHWFWLSQVDVFQATYARWYTLEDLPHPLKLPSPSATICGGQLHVIGGSTLGYSCSLQALIESSRSPGLEPHLISWTSLPLLPVIEATPANFCGQLVIIGGKDQSSSPVNSIYLLENRKWKEVGSMASGRSECLVASPLQDKIIIVGGEGAHFNSDMSVEEFVLLFM